MFLHKTLKNTSRIPCFGAEHSDLPGDSGRWGKVRCMPWPREHLGGGQREHPEAPSRGYGGDLEFAEQRRTMGYKKQWRQKQGRKS